MTAHKELIDGVTITFPILSETNQEMLLTFGYSTKNSVYIMTDGDAVMHKSKKNFLNYPAKMTDETFETVVKPILLKYSKKKQKEVKNAIQNT